MLPKSLRDRLTGRASKTGLAADYQDTLNQRTGVVGRPVLPDLAELDPDDPSDCRRLAAAVVRVLKAFDPRIEDIRVNVTATADGLRLVIRVTLTGPTNRLSIEAVLEDDHWNCQPLKRISNDPHS